MDSLRPILLFLFLYSPNSGLGIELWSPGEQPDEFRQMTAKWEKKGLKLTLTNEGKARYAWVSFEPEEAYYNLSSSATLSARLTNHGDAPVYTMLWAVGGGGMSAVGDFAMLEPGQGKDFTANLWDTFPDGSPKIDPRFVTKIQIMVRSGKRGTMIGVEDLKVSGEAPSVQIEKRWFVPEVTTGKPTKGKRVRYWLYKDRESDIACCLYLPEDWEASRDYPVIVEYPGNIFLNEKCYSTGLPDQCVIGYGMSEGKAIWVSLPFIDRAANKVVEDGFGNADDTAQYTEEVIGDICRNYGGDRERIILTGFSRGSIACGYIGLRNDSIAKRWLGIHGCQHYDGSNWRQSDIPGAIERAKRFSGKAIFQTDNSKERYKPVQDATDPSVRWTWVKSNLGAHATNMFLDDRPSTLALREWYSALVTEKD